ncbi:MAG: hypothetical protein ABIT38_08180 [Gemmatimonadaceae bacterium]
MKTTRTLLLTTMATLFLATTALAQETSIPPKSSDAKAIASATTKADTTVASDSGKPTAAKTAKVSMVQKIEIQRLRPVDQRGINVYESPKNDDIPYDGFKLSWGAAFTQQFQGLGHENTATPVLKNGVNANQLLSIGHGFNNAVANLYLNAQLAPGIRVAMTSYLSARHHQETWVKDGYLLVDESPLKLAALQKIMQYVTIRAGHFEINYGDEHFRRTDNGNAMYNPFVGNLIMDAFTTEIGGEVYVRNGPWMAMAGMTGGETRGQVTSPEKRSPAYLGKVGFDQKLSDNVRFRITGSLFSQSRSANNSLFSGDRGGSRYYQVMVNTAGTEKDSAWTGNLQPGFRSETHAWVLNPFVKVGGLELHGNIEQAKGRAATETVSRKFNQYAGEALYRFAGEKLFFGGRYNTVKGQFAGMTNDVSVNRYQLGGGWFLTPTVMLKGEWMNQKYNDFPTIDIRNGGQIKGFVMEGVVAF